MLNLDSGMNVALTQNYVSASNLSDVLRFIKMKPQQISGCRDRADAIQPRDLLEKFTERLKEVRPDLLDDAQQMANKGWNCNAWEDDEQEDETCHRQEKRQKTSNSSSIIDRAKVESRTDPIGFQFDFCSAN